MFKRMRYQEGYLGREKRQNGPNVWVFRWREASPDGGRVQRKVVIGTVQKYATETDAKNAVAALRIDINKETPRAALSPMTVEQLVAHYLAKELPEDNSKKAYSTGAVYRAYINNWILPRWKSYRVSEVKAVAIEEWLGSLELANGSKAKIRNILSAIFRHAMRYEWLDKNPVALVRQSAKPEGTPEVLDVEELRALLSNLEQPYRTMVFLAACTGLRVSELRALKWSDIDFETLEIRLGRAVVHQVVGSLKTETSRKPIPVDTELAEALLDVQLRSAYQRQDDWVFASPITGGKQPYWPENLLRRHIRPAATRAGITKRIGWHTFRHTFSTLLKANGEDVKTVQELLRHANSRITLDTYTQATTPAKRQAQSRVVRMLVGDAGKPSNGGKG